MIVLYSATFVEHLSEQFTQGVLQAYMSSGKVQRIRPDRSNALTHCSRYPCPRIESNVANATHRRLLFRRNLFCALPTILFKGNGPEMLDFAFAGLHCDEDGAVRFCRNFEEIYQSGRSRQSCDAPLCICGRLFIFLASWFENEDRNRKGHA